MTDRSSSLTQMVNNNSANNMFINTLQITSRLHVQKNTLNSVSVSRFP